MSISGQPDPYLSLLKAVISRTVKLAAKWQAVGFVHGVLNTDNMSILGETIDYGPFGFLERFDPNFTPNTTDFSGRRYSFRGQPGVVQWNLMALATSFVTEGLCEKVSLTWHSAIGKLGHTRKASLGKPVSCIFFLFVFCLLTGLAWQSDLLLRVLH